MANLNFNHEVESTYIKSMAKNLIYRYKHIQQFKTLNINDIFFVRDETLNQKFKKHIEIKPSPPEIIGTTKIKFIIYISKEFDNFDKFEQERLVFHTLLHIPSNYLQQAQEKNDITLRKHDIEMFIEESEFLQDVRNYELNAQQVRSTKLGENKPQALPY